MKESEITTEDLEQLAMKMAMAIPELDCPDCCECGVVFHYIEKSAKLYHEEWTWAFFTESMLYLRTKRRSIRAQ